MTTPDAYIQELALKLASAEKELRERAAGEKDPAMKKACEEAADRFAAGYRALHGIPLDGSSTIAGAVVGGSLLG